MAEPKLKAPVGKSPRISPGDKVANNRDDVIVVQNMLRANGFNVPVTGKPDAGTIKAIGNAQKKFFKEKEPDCVVDPKGQLFAAMTPKYKTYVKELENTKYYKLPYKGEILVPEKDYKRIEAQILKDMNTLLKIHRRSYETYLAVLEDYHETCQLRDGVLKAVGNAVVVKVGMVKLPSTAIANKAGAALVAFEKTVVAKDFAGMDKTLPAAEKAVDAFFLEMIRFHKDLTGKALKIGTALKVTTATGWAVVGCMAAPVIVTGMGVSAGTATVIAGTGTAVMQSAADEIGAQLTEKKSVWESVRDIVVDGAVGAAASALPAVKMPFVEKVSAGLAGRVASKVPMLANPQAQAVLTRYFSHTGKEVLIEAGNGAMKILATSVKKGKMPTEKEFQAATQDIAFKLLTAGLMKRMQGFDAKMGAKHKDFINKTIFPAAIKRTKVGNTLPAAVQAKVMGEVVAKTKESAIKYGFDEAVGVMTGSEDPEKMAKLAMKGLEKNKEFQRIVDKAVADALKNQNVPAK